MSEIVGRKDFRLRTYRLSVDTLKFLNQLKLSGNSRPLLNQLVRSVTSIGANVVEGRAASSKKDWINFFQIALKSANETKYWLCLLRDVHDLQKTRIRELIKETDEVSKILAASIITIKTREAEKKR